MAELGLVEHATKFADLLAPFAKEFGGFGSVACYGPVALPLGRAELLAGGTAEGEGHFRQALALAEEGAAVSSGLCTGASG